jgi:hypothetical protein
MPNTGTARGVDWAFQIIRGSIHLRLKAVSDAGKEALPREADLRDEASG